MAGSGEKRQDLRLETGQFIQVLCSDLWESSAWEWTWVGSERPPETSQGAQLWSALPQLACWLCHHLHCLGGTVLLALDQAVGLELWAVGIHGFRKPFLHLRLCVHDQPHLSWWSMCYPSYSVRPAPCFRAQDFLEVGTAACCQGWALYWGWKLEMTARLRT